MTAQEERGVPILVPRPADCCGCSACAAVCPFRAISMCPDAEGFDYPVIDPILCVGCMMCVMHCPVRRRRASEAGDADARCNSEGVTSQPTLERGMR
jgi:ferredoxin